MNYYQQLITGESKEYVVPVFRWIDKMKILAITLTALQAYKKKGARHLLHRLQGISPIRKIRFDNATQSLLFARNICVFAQMIINYKNPQAICLERASVICTALRSMGLPAQVIIGRKASANSASDYDFHAWVELDGSPVNDFFSNKTHFMEIERLPS
ncbi:lasso peptide biosynthesis B2 protein [Paenibacillus popilliae]|uniref:Transglutaminase-like enzyme n=1 Tax=Paenibacillus popilliae ATCC 14706 TaxID=1212764 RepID=M9M3P8_PAEPP|nr:lasso peptide biosynthesis B2 protein [Paenibacillus popilliae]GAC43644.1 transglutaminase-like enzyme [Paenibacillus popilliae ATCC 14706]